MTPAERVAELRSCEADMDGGNGDRHHRDYCRSMLLMHTSKLLALAEAVPARLAAGHSELCLWDVMARKSCYCGHNALAAAWAALGDG